MRDVVVLEKIDDRRIRKKLRQKKRRSETAMADNQIRLQIAARTERIEDGVGMPDGVLERPGTKMRRLCRAARKLVLDLFNPLDRARLGLAHKRAAPTELLHQVLCDVAE